MPSSHWASAEKARMPPSRLANILAFHSLGIGLGSHYKGATPYGRLGKEFRN
ncbi:MAG: hypothetical protein QXO94_06605 [Candidatus Bathyarchaeia archaeon]